MAETMDWTSTSPEQTLHSNAIIGIYMHIHVVMYIFITTLLSNMKYTHTEHEIKQEHGLTVMSFAVTVYLCWSLVHWVGYVVWVRVLPEHYSSCCAILLSPRKKSNHLKPLLESAAPSSSVESLLQLPSSGGFAVAIATSWGCGLLGTTWESSAAE